MLKEQLEQVFGFALQEDTFSKAEIARRARYVCVYGLGKYFEDAFLRQNIRARFGVTHLCDGNPERREKIRQDIAPVPETPCEPLAEEADRPIPDNNVER